MNAVVEGIILTGLITIAGLIGAALMHWALNGDKR